MARSDARVSIDNLSLSHLKLMDHRCLRLSGTSATMRMLWLVFHIRVAEIGCSFPCFLGYWRYRAKLTVLGWMGEGVDDDDTMSFLGSNSL